MSPRSTATTRHALAITLISALCLLVPLFLLALNYNNIFSLRRDISWLEYDDVAESRAEAIRVPQVVYYEASAQPADVHTLRDDGDVMVGTDAPRHPVLHILDHANREWESVVNAHDGDEERAMQQYRYRYTGKTKPASELANLNLPIHAPLHLFNPIPSSLLDSRQQEAAILTDTFTLSLHSGVPRITYGNLSHSISQEDRARRVEHLLTAIKPFVQSLPDLRATFSLLSHPRQAIPFEASDVLEALAADQPLPRSPFKFRSQAEPAGPEAPHGCSIHDHDLARLEGIMTKAEQWSWQGGCRAKYDTEEAPEDEEQKGELPPPIRLVGFPKARSDPCVHRELTELHPFFEIMAESSYHRRISPIVSDTTAPWASDILLPPLDFFASQDTEETVPAVSWDKKTSGTFWRGPSTEEQPTHPASRLIHLFNVTAKESEQELILPVEEERFYIDRIVLNDMFTYDVRPGDDEEAKRDEAGWKFLVDVGEGVRMRERMMSGGLVFRPVLLGDWFTERSVPWVHYVPVQPDLSDLPSLIAFFEQHDDLARRIAEGGQAWAREQLNHERAHDSVREVLEGFAGLGVSA